MIHASAKVPLGARPHMANAACEHYDPYNEDPGVADGVGQPSTDGTAHASASM